MVIRNKRCLIVWFLSVLISVVSFAQEIDKKTPLKTVFETLQKLYDVQFNYVEDAINNIAIEAPKKELSLSELLLYLESKTNLSYTLTNQNLILVSIKEEMQLQNLSEVVISGYIVKGINKLSDGSYEINISDFDALPGLIDTDVLQAVQAFPGIQSSNETVSNINIRGGTHDQNLILWDDIKMYQSGHFFGLISMFNPQITQHVSLTKNGSRTEYTDGVSGTISMETDKNISQTFEGNVGVNFIDVNGFADIPLSQRSSIQIAARKSISDFTQTPTYDNYFDRISQDTEIETNVANITNSDQEFDFYDMSLRWLYKISDKDMLRVNFINVANELMFNENTTNGLIRDSRESSLNQNSIAGAIHYNRIWNDKWQTTFEAYETDYKLKSVNANVLDAQQFLQENIVSETSLKLKADYSINNRLQWQNGYHFVETKVTNLDDVDIPVFRSLISEVVRTHGAFTQVSYKSPEAKTNLGFGLRYNYIGKFRKHLLEPRFSLSHRFMRHFTFEVLGELKHQVTSQVINFQNDFLGIEKRRWQLSNDNDIPVIRSRQVSLGINYTNKGWLISAEPYYKKVKGITTQSQGFQNQYEFVRTDGNYEVLGFDVIIRKQLTNFNSWLSYSYMNNDYTFESLLESSFPSNFDITHALTFGMAYSYNQLSISAGLSWNSGKPTTRPVVGNEVIDDQINYNNTNSEQLRDYLRVDLSALYDFKLSATTRGYIGVSLWNILDRENIINNFYRSNNNASVTEVRQRSLGFTPNATFRVKF